mmetsp:Transcript_120793/g.337063  ORF Transcript_120793/g.337063 Transcript_120793/m.337063 type:complete len:239 (+) Transcript_120793:292-1008(+)
MLDAQAEAWTPRCPGQVPGVSDRCGEELVARNQRRQILVIPLKLCTGDLSVLADDVEAADELRVDLLLGFAPIAYIRMCRAAELHSQVLHRDHPIAVHVQRGKGVLHDCSAQIRQLASKRIQELVEVDAPGPVLVEVGKDQVALAIVLQQPQPLETLSELCGRQDAGALGVHLLEDLQQRDLRSHSLPHQPVPEVVDQRVQSGRDELRSLAAEPRVSSPRFGQRVLPAPRCTLQRASC